MPISHTFPIIVFAASVILLGSITFLTRRSISLAKKKKMEREVSYLLPKLDLDYHLRRHSLIIGKTSEDTSINILGLEKGDEWPPDPIRREDLGTFGESLGQPQARRSATAARRAGKDKYSRSSEAAIEYFRLFMQGAVSLGLLSAAGYVILSGHYDQGDKHWAYGSIGTILGYWLKGK